MKPCPFCGSNARVVSRDYRGVPYFDLKAVKCTRCGARGPLMDTAQLAKFYWDERISEK